MMNKFHEIIGGRKEKLIKDKDVYLEHKVFMEQIKATKPHEPFVLQGNSEGNERLQKAFETIMKKYEEKLAKQHKLHDQALSAQRDRRIPSVRWREQSFEIFLQRVYKSSHRGCGLLATKGIQILLLIYCSKVPIMH